MILGDDKHPGLISKGEFTAQEFKRKGARAPGKDARLKSCTSPSREGKAGLTLYLKLSPAKNQGLDSPQGFGQPAEAHKLGAGLPETPAVVEGQKSAPSGLRISLQHLLEVFVLLSCLSNLRGSGWVFACPPLHQALLQGRALGWQWDEPHSIYHSQRNTWTRHHQGTWDTWRC